MKAVRQIGQPMVESNREAAGVRRPRMDEHRRRSWLDKWAAGFCDLETGPLIHLVAGSYATGSRNMIILSIQRRNQCH